MLKLTSKQDIKDFATGCCFFGTGGGGNISFGERMLHDVLDAGKEITIIDTDAVDDDNWIVCPYLMGTSGPETEEVKQAKIKCGVSTTTIGNMPAAATELLLRSSSIENIKLSAIIPYEIGAAATSSAVATAALLGLPTIDADFVGRSVPEATQMLPALYGMDLCPTTNADAFGNESIITKAINRHMIERTGKFVASASFGLIGQATLLRQAKELKKYMLAGTLSKAYLVGKALRENDVEKALNDLIGAKKIFEGTISKFDGKDEDGYYVGTISVTGNNDYQGSILKIWFKNENHIAWIDEKVSLTSPDLISIIDQHSHQPYVNNELREGMEITIFGTPSHSAWQDKPALGTNCPRYYGFDIDIKSID